MKHIQTYEDVTEPKRFYWLVSTDKPDFEISMRKVGADEESINILSKIIYNQRIKRPNWRYTNLIKEENDGKIYWSYGGSGSDSVNGKYMGNINLSELDRVADQYNL